MKPDCGASIPIQAGKCSREKQGIALLPERADFEKEEPDDEGVRTWKGCVYRHGGHTKPSGQRQAAKYCWRASFGRELRLKLAQSLRKRRARHSPTLAVASGL